MPDRADAAAADPLATGAALPPATGAGTAMPPGPDTGTAFPSTPDTGPTTSPQEPHPQAGWLASLQAIWQELPGLVSDRVDLLALELQRAGQALAQLVALLVAAAILGVTAWLALWAGITVGLVQLGLHWAVALALVLALNAGCALLALGRMRRLLPLLRLPATRRHLSPRPAAPNP